MWETWEDRRSWGTARIWAFCEAVEGDTADALSLFYPVQDEPLMVHKAEGPYEFFVN